MQKEIAQGILTDIEADLPNQPLAIYAVHHKKKWKSKNITSILDLLEEKIFIQADTKKLR